MVYPTRLPMPTLMQSRNSISCSGAKNLKLLRDQGKLFVKNESESKVSSRLKSAVSTKDFFDMINVEKVIFKNEFYSQPEDKM